MIDKIKNLHSTNCETFLGYGFDPEEAHFANNYSEDCFEKYCRAYKSVMKFNDVLIFVEMLSIQKMRTEWSSCWKIGIYMMIFRKRDY